MKRILTAIALLLPVLASPLMAQQHKLPTAGLRNQMVNAALDYFFKEHSVPAGKAVVLINNPAFPVKGSLQLYNKRVNVSAELNPVQLKALRLMPDSVKYITYRYNAAADRIAIEMSEVRNEYMLVTAYFKPGSKRVYDGTITFRCRFSIDTEPMDMPPNNQVLLAALKYVILNKRKQLPLYAKNVYITNNPAFPLVDNMSYNNTFMHVRGDEPADHLLQRIPAGNLVYLTYSSERQGIIAHIKLNFPQQNISYDLAYEPLGLGEYKVWERAEGK